MISKFILKYWCCLASVEKLSGIFKFLFLNSVERDVLQHLDSSMYNQAAHFLSHSTPCNCCVPTARNAVICLEVIISVTYMRATDMRVILCLPFCIILNVWLVYFRQKNTFYYRNLFLRTNAKGDTWKKWDKYVVFIQKSLKIIGIATTDGQRKDEENRLF